MSGLLGVVENIPVELSQLAAGNFRAMKKEVIINGAGALLRGRVLGKITKALGTVAADGGNTGNGSVTGASLGVKAKAGTYALECIAAVTDGGIFKVTAPDGSALPDASVSAGFANAQINFTINDGGTDFVEGDKFTIDVDVGSEKFTGFVVAAVDGSQDPRGILAEDADASSADVNAEVFGVGEYRTVDIIWPGSITAAQKAAAVERLQDRGIIIK